MSQHAHDHAHDDPHDHRHHDHHSHFATPHHASERRLRRALVLLSAFTLFEAAGGFWANSIALLAEATHMLADSASLLLGILAIRFGRRVASADRTYGNRRFQTLAAYTNGLTLLALTIWVLVEAVRRLIAPPEVNGTVMLGVAAVGAVANVAAYMVLSGASSLNERSARAHVMSDVLGSIAAIAAACIILATGWLPADPLLSIVVSFLILRSGWQLTRESAHVLLEGTPANFDPQQVEKELKDLPGVCDIHHLHAWSLTGEAPIVTLHAQLFEHADRQQTLAVILENLGTRFGVEHATVQIEEGPCAAPNDDCHAPVANEDAVRR
ncbi:MAG TPA: cation diffusion facilitator family transporter [Pseudomonadales bacterium]|jgi:cobalt-zinc-cadmium efflux system protein|nr:cation diffusion facilitator family transporter [Pseudomonadales bacterium]